MKQKTSHRSIILFSLLVSLLICFNFKQAHAATDTTAPVVKSISIDKSLAKEGETISITLDLVEEETGIVGICVNFILVSELTGTHPIGIEMDYSKAPIYSGKVTLTNTVYAADLSGLYSLYYVSAIDQNGNKGEYSRDWGAPCPQDETGKYLESLNNSSNHCYINGPDAVEFVTSTTENVPSLNTIELKTLSVGENGNIVLELDSDNADQIDDVNILMRYLLNGQYVRADLDKNKKITIHENKLTYSADVSDTMQTGSYVIDSVSLVNSRGDITSYFNREDEWDKYQEEDGRFYLLSQNGDKCFINGSGILKVNTFVDITEPTLSNAVIRESKIKKPGVIHIDISASDDKGLSYIMAELKLEDKGVIYYPSITFEKGTKSYEGTFEVPVSSTAINGNYYFGNIVIIDLVGNEKMYQSVEGMVTIEDEFNVAFDLGLNNSKLLENVKRLQEGETGRIGIKSTYRTAGKELFEAIQGKDVNLVFASDYYRWVFNGKDIVSPKDIDLNISLAVVKGTDYGSDENLLEVTFADNGKLPGMANVRFKSDYIKNIFSLTGNCYLYYENEAEEQLELQTTSAIRQIIDGTDHWCDFRISHNSKFLCSGKKLSKLSMKQVNKTTKKKAPSKGTVLKDKKTGNKYKVLIKGKQAAFCGTKKQSKVVIPATISIDGFKYKITAITANAMKNNKTVRSVTIGKQVKTIGKNAFYGCIKLAKVSGAQNVTKINSGAFSGCKKLTAVALGGKLTEIDAKSFYNCSALQKVTIPVKISKIGKSAFYGCKKLKTITIKTSKLTSAKIGSNAFKGIHKKAVIRVPKKKLKSYTAFLKKKGIGKTVKISA